jgi:transcriptional regulator with XRE-family HTH domain
MTKTSSLVDPEQCKFTAIEQELLSGAGAKLRKMRLAQARTQANLARAASINPRYLSEYERGKANISLLALYRLSSALGITITYLVPEEDRIGSYKRYRKLS